MEISEKSKNKPKKMELVTNVTSMERKSMPFVEFAGQGEILF